MFVFFGPVAVLGTVITQGGPPGALAVVARGRGGHARLRGAGGQQPARHPDRRRRGQAHAGRACSATATPAGCTRRWSRCRSCCPRAGRAAQLADAAGAAGRAARGAAGPPRARRGRGPSLIPVLARTGVLLLAWSALTAVGLGARAVRLTRLSARPRGASASAAAVARAAGRAARPARRPAAPGPGQRRVEPRRAARGTAPSTAAAPRSAPTSTAMTSGTPASTSSAATRATSASRASA